MMSPKKGIIECRVDRGTGATGFVSVFCSPEYGTGKASGTHCCTTNTQGIGQPYRKGFVIMSDFNAHNRRCFLGSSMAALAATGAALASAADQPGAKPADPKASPSSPTDAHPSGMPYAKIGNVKISRLMMGGNLVSGCMHARDLRYVPQLFRAYVTEAKILETYKICEENGITTVLGGGGFIKRYNEKYNGHLQPIACVGVVADQPVEKVKDGIKQLIDSGNPAIYVWGQSGDELVRANRVDQITRFVELGKAFGIPVGVGGHSLKVIVECEKAHVPADFYVKTLHTDDYFSATPKELRKEYIWLDGGKGWEDNMWCIDAQETINFMKTVRKPWIAFKVLAAGAIPPRKGFSYAFKNGADIIAVGMFDFHIKEDCALVKQSVRLAQQRPRPWCA
jgi:hypothetical protein